MKAMYIYELADKAGVSERTLRRWIKREYRREDKKKLLPPYLVKDICYKYGIDL